MTKPFDNKVALVTGAGTGIGAGVAKMLARRGARVTLVGRRREPLDTVAAQIRDAGGVALVVQGDVASHDDMQNAVARTVDHFSALHLAVNNAGIVQEGTPIAETSVEEWNRVIAINLSGIFYGMKYQIPAMLAAGGGAIVNISSIFSERGIPGSAAYVAAKHGIHGLTRTAAREYVKQNIRVNEILPGMTATDMTAGSPQTDALTAIVPLGRLGTPEEVAAAICFLLSDEAAYITGARLAVDAGFLT